MQMPQKPPQIAQAPSEEFIDTLSQPNWKDPTFVNWFFQKAPEVEDVLDG
jgi:hypothetical protein